jgi:glycosyltransferase involved in cell wall biosynthesis
MRPLLVQPASGGRISGGFLYNARMAEHGLWDLLDVVPAELPQRLAGLTLDRPILMDSIWLTPEAAPYFFALQARGARLGSMLHSFPSMIAATENHQPPPARPSTFELEASERLDVVVVPGRHYEDLLRDFRAVVLCAEPGIDDAWRSEPRRRNGACRLVSVGAVTPRKGFLDVLDALDALDALEGSRLDYRWSVIGSLEADPTYASALSERARGRSNVELLGQLAPGVTRSMVQQADLLLMPSYDENQPLVLLEAIAASVPAVAYAAGATRHMLEHEREGLIAAVGDKPALAAHLRRLLEDEPSRYRMATQCWERQRSLPSWQGAARRAGAALAERFEMSLPR